MITSKDIRITHEEVDNSIEVMGGVKITQMARVDKDSIYGYSGKIDTVKLAEKQIKWEILNKIYGDIEKQARESYMKVKKIVQYNPHFSYDAWKELDEAFAPLLNIVKNSENKVE